MKIGAGTTLTDVAVIVGDALLRNHIRGVLTGGACAALHSRGGYVSRDVDFVLPSETAVRDVDLAMASIGFRREGSRYVHEQCDFYVEFPAGPLAIGGDLSPRPVRVRRGRATALTLSATDACRDRLAAYYHWQDRQALATAVRIACLNRVWIRRIRTWSETEDSLRKFEEFLALVHEARRSRRPVSARGR